MRRTRGDPRPPDGMVHGVRGVAARDAGEVQMKIKDHSDGKYQVHLYADGNLVVRRNADETVVGSVGTTEARTTGPTAPPPEPKPTPGTLPYENWVYDKAVSDRENIRRAYVGYLGREPSDAEVDAYLANSIDVASDIRDIASSGEAARHRSKPPPTTPVGSSGSSPVRWGCGIAH